MSTCVECGNYMDDMEATLWEECRQCRHGRPSSYGHKIRTIVCKGAEQKGRPGRANPKALPELDDFTPGYTRSW